MKLHAIEPETKRADHSSAPSNRTSFAKGAEGLRIPVEDITIAQQTILLVDDDADVRPYGE